MAPFKFDENGEITGHYVPLDPPTSLPTSDHAIPLDEGRRGIDELFRLVKTYRTGPEYMKLMDFVRRFKFYSPYNAMLIHMQRPGASYVATPKRWRDVFHRRIMAGSSPIVILQPMGPVMFVFDVSDTEPLPGAPPLPNAILDPFEVRRGDIGGELEMVIENAARDGVRITDGALGSQRAGELHAVQGGQPLHVIKNRRYAEETVSIPLRYELILNPRSGRATKFATLAHELGHLYCGHLGSPNEKWWQSRMSLSRFQEEFEAESVSYLVCRRLDIDTPSEEYLYEYAVAGKEIPPISVDAVLKSAGLIEKMSQSHLSLRKEN